MKVFDITMNGKRWRIASLHGRMPHKWAWLVNIDKPMEQVRLSVTAPEFDHMPSLREDKEGDTIGTELQHQPPSPERFRVSFAAGGASS